jgi:mycothiol synthase
LDWISSDPAFRADLTFLATVENQTVGFIASAKDMELPDNHGYIIQVGVIPEWRRKGVAAVLTNISLEAWREDGKDAVILHVNRNNPGAISLYERLGFKTVRIRGAFQK